MFTLSLDLLNAELVLHSEQHLPEQLCPLSGGQSCGRHLDATLQSGGSLIFNFLIPKIIIDKNPFQTGVLGHEKACGRHIPRHHRLRRQDVQGIPFCTITFKLSEN